MPMTGGAIQLAHLPGSTTRPMSDATNSRSSALGSHLSSFSRHWASLTTWPSGDTRTPDRLPIRRLNALCGTWSRKGSPAFSITLFQRETPPTESLMKSSRRTSLSALSMGTSFSTSAPSLTSSTL